MVIEPSEQDADLPRLALEHDGGPPDARQTGAMLDRVAYAYRAYSRLVAQPPEYASDLVIEEMRVGSLYVVLRDVLDIAGAVLTAYEHRELLGGFVTQLNDAMGAMRRFGSPLPMYRNALEALSAPVRTGRATTVKLTVIGDNNRILIIDKESAEDIKSFLASKPRTERGRNPRSTQVRRPFS